MPDATSRNKTPQTPTSAKSSGSERKYDAPGLATTGAPASANAGHCPTCVCGRRAPVQSSQKHQKGPGSVAWWEHEQAWAVYGARYSRQDAERIAERGGFGYDELVTFLGHEPTTWSPRGR